MPRFVVFWTISTVKDEKSAAKFHYIKTVGGKVVHNQLPFEWYQYIGRGIRSPGVRSPGEDMKKVVYKLFV